MVPAELSGIMTRVTRTHVSGEGKCDVIVATEKGEFYLLSGVSAPAPEIESNIILPFDWHSNPSTAGRVSRIEFTA